MVTQQTPFVNELFAGRMGLQGYDQHRFANQMDALVFGLNHPLGIGPGQSEQHLDFSTHSLYARLFIETGAVGTLAFLAFVAMSLERAYWCSKRVKGDLKGVYVLIFVALTGLIFNSFFVDTLHWRHFWLLLALAWIPPYEKTAAEAEVRS